MQNETDLYNGSGSHTAVDFIIGLLITLAASLANALGLNITKLDFTRQEQIPVSQRRPDFLRPYWVLGLVLYIASQVLGSTLALNYLPAQYVAPLGSTSLVFNFLFAFWLVGTPITRLDIIGTITIVVGVVGVVVFGNQHNSTTPSFDENNLSLSLLKQIWGRKDWIAYIVCLEFATVVFWWLARITGEVCFSRITDERGDADRDGSGLDAMVSGGGGRRNTDPYAGEGFVGKVKSARDSWHRKQGKVRESVKGMVERWSQSRPETSVRKLAGLMWSITGGLLSGQTLVLAKSAVKLVTAAINKSDASEGNQFASPLTWLIVILLVVCAVAQVYCLNASLKCYDSTFCVPCFFATYTTSGFINSLVYLDQTKTYATWAFVLIWLSIAILIFGVILLSSKPSPKPPKTRPGRSNSTGSVAPGQNPFDDRYELDSAVKPSFARTATEAETATAPSASALSAAISVEAEERKRGQGWLGKLFGGLPTVRPSRSPVEPTSSSSSDPPKGQFQQRHRQDDLNSVAGDSVLASGGASQKGVDEMELDEVDRLGYESPSLTAGGSVRSRRGSKGSVGGARGEEEDWGEFEEATGARRVE
ncbi:hypothetical protein JCM11641_005301 [Rhodosporidiobolus odoratus]